MGSPLNEIDYDDSEVREFGIRFLKEKFNLTYKSNEKIKAIDLISPTDKNIGAELERGGWLGDFWVDNRYCKISRLPHSTINIPFRKINHWYQKNDLSSPNLKSNIFLRTNNDFSQVIIIRPETIKDKNKIKFASFIPNNSHTTEYWMCFKREDVETYNLINNEYILINEP